MTCLLQKSLGEDYLILEEGLSGRTTSFRDPVFEGLSGLDYLYPCLMSHEPVDLLVIMLGTNDTKERFSAGAPAIGLGMIRLVKKAIATTDCWRNGRAADPDRDSTEYRQRIRKLKCVRNHGKRMRREISGTGRRI